MGSKYFRPLKWKEWWALSKAGKPRSVQGRLRLSCFNQARMWVCDNHVSYRKNLLLPNTSPLTVSSGMKHWMPPTWLSSTKSKGWWLIMAWHWETWWGSWGSFSANWVRWALLNESIECMSEDKSLEGLQLRSEATWVLLSLFSSVISYFFGRNHPAALQACLQSLHRAQHGGVQLPPRWVQDVGGYNLRSCDCWVCSC